MIAEPLMLLLILSGHQVCHFIPATNMLQYSDHSGHCCVLLCVTTCPLNQGKAPCSSWYNDSALLLEGTLNTKIKNNFFIAMHLFFVA